MPERENFIFITGGRRSGKSSFALELAGSFGARKLYIATARIFDAEMEERIARHRAERKSGWDTVEEPIEISRIIGEVQGYDVILVDCLTLWLCNVMHEGQGRVSDDAVMKEIDLLAEACRGSKAPVIVVSNELGSGIIPDNPLSRRFSDLAGMMNQRMAAAADRVVLTVSGIPVTIKE